jgi:hypothetical protein
MNKPGERSPIRINDNDVSFKLKGYAYNYEIDITCLDDLHAENVKRALVGCKFDITEITR